VFCDSNAALYARQRLSGVEKQPLKDADGLDGSSSSTVMSNTRTLLLRYQRLLISQFIAVDRPHHATVLLGSMSSFFE